VLKDNVSYYKMNIKNKINLRINNFKQLSEKKLKSYTDDYLPNFLRENIEYVLNKIFGTKIFI